MISGFKIEATDDSILQSKKDAFKTSGQENDFPFSCQFCEQLDFEEFIFEEEGPNNLEIIAASIPNARSVPDEITATMFSVDGSALPEEFTISSTAEELVVFANSNDLIEVAEFEGESLSLETKPKAFSLIDALKADQESKTPENFDTAAIESSRVKTNPQPIKLMPEGLESGKNPPLLSDSQNDLQNDFQSDLQETASYLTADNQQDINGLDVDSDPIVRQAELENLPKRLDHDRDANPGEKQSLSQPTVDQAVSRFAAGLNVTDQRLSSSQLEVSVESPKSSPADVTMIDQITDKLTSSSISINKNGSTQIRLQIYPQELGYLTITVFRQQEELRASIVASEWSASEILIRDKSLLVEAFKEKGLEIADVNISLRNSNGNSMGDSSASKQDQHHQDQVFAWHRQPIIGDFAESAFKPLRQDGTAYAINVIA